MTGLIYSGRLGVEDGYQLGDPEMAAAAPDTAVTATAGGIIVLTDPATDVVVVEVYLNDNDGGSSGAPPRTGSVEQVLEVVVEEPWKISSWEFEPPEPPAPPLLGPGKWRIDWSATQAQAEDPRESDLAEDIVEEHVLVLTPLDDLARSWHMPITVEAGSATERDDISEGASVRAGVGTWALSWRTTHRRAVAQDGQSERVELDDDAVLMRFDRRSEIHLAILGRSKYEGRLSRLLGEKWVSHVEAAIPAGRVIGLSNPKGESPRGLAETVAVGPARVVVALRHPDAHDLVELEDGSATIVSYDRDTDFAQDVRVLVLLE
ncbi:hypothetical protein FHP29_13620 [Nocardioides albidus]|uniref:Uncharacterized protein n=1 Tax=Nocardioides albidus TaxID=1517589 RepID=A0A5C4VR32_9ACTN|nr:hypothetical protein [Nocardioides albidus]TNM38310.1 hypothetical protein FHP29_13620 [Nocardioides albidus]